MITSSTFPLSAGAVLSLSCNEGYEQSGDKEVTCTKNTEFQFNQEPICGELGGGQWRKMAKNGDGEFGFFICQIRRFSPIFYFGISD